MIILEPVAPYPSGTNRECMASILPVGGRQAPASRSSYGQEIVPAQKNPLNGLVYRAEIAEKNQAFQSGWSYNFKCITIITDKNQ